MDLPAPPQYKFRRRKVMKVRVTWLGMVFVLLTLVVRSITMGNPGMGKTAEFATFVAIVVVPMLLLVLWQLGLLPPERVLVDGDQPPS